ncbi:MAG: mRNA surveillance protein pelota [Nanoarchaeota archaeon]
MRIIKKDLKHGMVSCLIEDVDDLWYLSQIIMPPDKVKGSTVRKIKIGGEDARSNKIIKKRMTLALIVEKVEFTGSQLRVLGTITEGPEDIPHGSYHSFGLEPGEKITITKEEWLRLHLEKLKEASEAKQADVLIVVFDRETAIFGKLKRQGFEILSRIEGEVQKKDVEQKAKGLYPEIIAKLKQYQERMKPSHIVLASPSFWKEELFKAMGKDAFPNMVQATVSSATENAFDELLKRGELRQVLQQERVAQDALLVEGIMGAISKDRNVSYGMDQVRSAAESGAVELLLVTDGLLLKSREDGKDAELDAIMKSVERAKGKVHFIASENDPGKQLDGLGGIAGKLRYKIL